MGTSQEAEQSVRSMPGAMPGMKRNLICRKSSWIWPELGIEAGRRLRRKSFLQEQHPSERIKANPAHVGGIDLRRRPLFYTPITPHNSFTAAALLSRPAFSSGVSLISMICSIPFAPSLTGTPT